MAKRRDPAEALTRLPPHDPEAEAAVVAACLVDEAALVQVSALVQPQDVWDQRLRWVYEAVVAVYRAGGQVDQITVAHQLQRAGHLEEVGGLAYLARLVAELPTTVGIEYWAQIVARDARYRAAISAAGRIQDLAYEGGDDYGAFAARVAAELEPLLAPVVGRRDLTPQEILEESYGLLDVLLEEPAALRGHSTGLAALDRLTYGLSPGKLYVLAGEPSVGKSALAAWMAQDVARAVKVVYVTLEMDGTEILTERLTFALAGVPKDWVRRGGEWVRRTGYTEEERARVRAAVTDLAERRLVIPTPSPSSVPAIRGVLLLHRDAGLLVVDYLSLLDVPRERGENFAEALGHVTRSLKELAREFRVPVLVLAQLNRGVEDRPNRRPELTDLRSSGRIEQDADVVMLLWRPGRFGLVCREDGRPYVKGEPYPEEYVEVIVPKARGGRTGYGAVWYDVYTQRWGDLENAR